MAEQQTNDSQWSPCPPGELRRVNDRFVRRDRNRTAMKWAATMSTILLVVVVTYGINGVIRSTQRPGDLMGNISCRDVRVHAAEFLAGNVDDELRQRIERHLELCPQCELFVRRMKEAQTQVPGPAQVVPAAFAERTGAPGLRRLALNHDFLQTPQFALAELPSR